MPSDASTYYLLAESANPFSVLATGSAEDMRRFVAEWSSEGAPESVPMPSSNWMLRVLTLFDQGR